MDIKIKHGLKRIENLYKYQHEIGRVLMKSKKNKSFIQAFLNEINKHNLDIIDNVCSEKITSWNIEGEVKNREEYKKGFAELLTAFPDFRFDIRKIIGEGDDVWVFATQHGTLTNSFYGIPPTNSKFEIDIVMMYELENNLITRDYLITDSLKLWEKLGVAVRKSNDPRSVELYLNKLVELGLLSKDQANVKE